MTNIKAPFFEIGPKSYLYGDQILDLAKAADEASAKYDVDIIFTCPVVDIRRVKEATSRIHVFAPHMDPIPWAAVWLTSCPRALWLPAPRALC